MWILSMGSMTTPTRNGDINWFKGSKVQGCAKSSQPFPTVTMISSAKARRRKELERFFPSVEMTMKMISAVKGVSNTVFHFFCAFASVRLVSGHALRQILSGPPSAVRGRCLIDLSPPRFALSDRANLFFRGLKQSRKTLPEMEQMRALRASGRMRVYR